MNHIRNVLPELRNRVNALLQSSREELNALGDPRIGVSKVCTIVYYSVRLSLMTVML